MFENADLIWRISVTRGLHFLDFLDVLTWNASKSIVIPMVNDYIACVYDLKWYVGVVCEVNETEQDCFVSFLHPSGPARSFVWPSKKDSCWIVYSDVLCIIKVPCTRNGRTYTIEEQRLIQSKFAERMKNVWIIASM